jgi:hypothetical protein
MSPIVTLYPAIVERRVAQLNSADREGGVPCTTRYITTTRGDGSSVKLWTVKNKRIRWQALLTTAPSAKDGARAIIALRRGG